MCFYHLCILYCSDRAGIVEQRDFLMGNCILDGITYKIVNRYLPTRFYISFNTTFKILNNFFTPTTKISII